MSSRRNSPYADGLWKSFARRLKPIAFLTSYSSQRLPRKAALDHIRGFSSRIVTTCLPAVHSDELPTPLSTGSPVASRRALYDKLKITAVRDFPVGRCSFVFDDAGNCVEETSDGPLAKFLFEESIGRGEIRKLPLKIASCVAGYADWHCARIGLNWPMLLPICYQEIPPDFVPNACALSQINGTAVSFLGIVRVTR
jgi:hypothetical protein